MKPTKVTGSNQLRLYKIQIHLFMIMYKYKVKEAMYFVDAESGYLSY